MPLLLHSIAAMAASRTDRATVDPALGVADLCTALGQDPSPYLAYLYIYIYIYSLLSSGGLWVKMLMVVNGL